MFTDGTVDNCATEQVGPTAAGLPAARRQGLRHAPRRTEGKEMLYANKNVIKIIKYK